MVGGRNVSVFVSGKMATSNLTRHFTRLPSMFHCRLLVRFNHSRRWFNDPPVYTFTKATPSIAEHAAKIWWVIYSLWYPVDNINGPIQIFPAYPAYVFVSDLIGGSTSLKTANIFPGRQVNGSSITTADGDPFAGQLSIRILESHKRQISCQTCDP
ncbi:hypothetical protein JVU11DRAFT_4018 [Chiua virens]|nr:hypothetical protein JVU11DRAFT_4018 [Chiua virens]